MQGSVRNDCCIDMFVVQRLFIEMKIEYHDYQGEEENEQGGQDQTDVLK